jgi:hypothetical protein
VISGQGLICKGIEIEGPVGERKAWTAAVLQAVGDLQSMNLRLRRAAEQCLLHNQKDFEFECASAGIKASNFRSRLLRRLPAMGPHDDRRLRAAA